MTVVLPCTSETLLNRSNKNYFRYRLSVPEAKQVADTVLKSQVDTDHVHPVSLLDIWSPKGLVPDHREMRWRELVWKETGKLPVDCSTLDAVLMICDKLKAYGFNSCEIDVGWRKLLHQQLRQLDEVTSRMDDLDVNILLRYHCLLWKTGEGWTYQRTPKERSVHSAYHPSIIGAFGDRTNVRTEMGGERFWSLDLDGGLDPSLAATTGTNEGWKEIGLLQFFTETLTLGKRLVGPVSQETVSVNLKSINRWGAVKARQESIDMGEDVWPNTLSDDEFTFTDQMKKLYGIRLDVLARMPYAQFLTQMRVIKDKTGLEYKRIVKALGDSDVGPLSNTLIAGTEERVPKTMRFKNKVVLKLREEKNFIPMLSSQDQTLNKQSMVYLFQPWRRPESEVAEVDNLAAVTDDDLKACDRVRLELFPASYYCCET